MNVQDIRLTFLEKYLHNEYVKDKTGCNMLEIISASFEADENYLIRKPNVDYCHRELEWYKSQSLNVSDIPGKAVKVWHSVADNKGFINSNYGYLIWSKENYQQYEHVKNELQQNPDSRRAVMIYNRPSIWKEYDRDGMSDFICTMGVHYLIRNDKLTAVVQMRSQDSTFGYCNDYFWQKYVLDALASDLGIEPGKIYWNVASLHVYPRDFICFEFFHFEII
jgi:thymidylate synthase